MKIHPTAQVDERAVFLGRTDLLEVGARSRIDAFCVLSVGDEGVRIDRRVHLSVGVCLYGQGGRIHLQDGSFLSARATVYTATDDMSADVLVGSRMDDRFRKVIKGPVIVGCAAGAGVGAVIFPGVTLEDASVLGALSIAWRDVPRGYVVVGPDQRRVRYRNATHILALLEEQLKEDPC